MNIQFTEQYFGDKLKNKTRHLFVSSQSFGALREELIKKLGLKQAKSLLFDYGWRIGVEAGKHLKHNELTFDAMLRKGPALHVKNGQINGIDYEGNIEVDQDNNVLHLSGKGTWFDSYEAIEQLETLGTANDTVCNTLTGYMSGFMSEICGEKVIGKEVHCVGKGDKECTWELKLLKDWGDEIYEEIECFEQTSIIKELEYTYEQLIEQRNKIDRLSEFHQDLTKEVISGNDLQTIIDKVYADINIPVTVEDLDFKIIAYSGIDESKIEELHQDMQTHIKKHLGSDYSNKRVLTQLGFEGKSFVTEKQRRIATAIQVHGKVVGYCTFIYLDKDEIDNKYDVLLLNRLGLAVSIILLNDKTKFETFERMKGNFLEEIIQGSDQTEQEIINRGNYLNIDLSLPFYICVLNFEYPESVNDNKWRVQEEILESVFDFFHKQKKELLISHQNEKITLLVTEESLESETIEELMNRFIHLSDKLYQQFKFKIGISNQGNKIHHADRRYEEALLALRLPNKDTIISYETLGIVGMFLSSGTGNDILAVAGDKLGTLYFPNDEKKNELMKTLFVFLRNGGKLEQTMNELAISMSGLNYRIKKIENMLGKDLRDPETAFELYLLLQSLIALGELDLEL